MIERLKTLLSRVPFMMPETVSQPPPPPPQQQLHSYWTAWKDAYQLHVPVYVRGRVERLSNAVTDAWTATSGDGSDISNSATTTHSGGSIKSLLLKSKNFLDGELFDRYSQRTTFILIASAIFTFSLLLVRTVRARRRGRDQQHLSTPVLEKGTWSPRTPQSSPSSSRSKFAQPSRRPGEWTPSEFTMPKPDPYPDWSIETTRPLPYRPFRYGPKYFVTMGLRNVKHTDWIELDNHFPRFHADKVRRIEERGHKCCKTAPEAYPAAMEFLQDLVEYLPERYPTLYRRTEVGIENLWSGETFDIIESPLKEDPMQMAAKLVQDDLAIMVERADGQYYLLAGAILLPGFWRLEDKFGMPLSEIHTSGDVPQFREKLEKGMTNFFRRLKAEEMVARNNYFIQVDDDLAWSHSIGSEDSDSDGIGWNTAAKNKAIEHHFFRSERQTLRRLPRTGAVVFTIRTYFHPVSEIVQEDYVPARLASAVRSWGDDVSRYKGKERYGDVLLEYLDAKHEEQLKSRGLDMSKEDDVRSYPY